MKYNSAFPSERLKPFIKNFWGIENQLSNGKSYAHRIIPSALPELILYIDKKPASLGRTMEDNLLINGQQNHFYDLLISEDLAVFSILFEPQGLFHFFDIPLSEFFNQSVPLKYLNKDLASELELRLLNGKDFQHRVMIAEEVLSKLLSKHHDAFEFKRMNHAVELIKQTQGNIKIDALAENVCLSRKQMERIFLKEIGISPKQYLKIVRFQATIFNRSQCKGNTLTELSYLSGYYDQSHFIADFKQYSGISPKDFFNEDCDPISDLFE